ncbi:MAG: transcriptional regulator [Bacteroides sp. SM23_62_1]|nr:MAG: transcriptional regulator [Bacteroides sp. SM23_62_1]
MKKIRIVDLTAQYNRLKEEIDASIRGVLESGAFIHGPEVKAFEEELGNYLHTGHVIACANGTDALQVALMSLDLEPGDEVITTPFSFISTIEVIRLLKLTPILVDIRPDTFNMDEGLIEDVITERTKAIIPVHLYGQCCRMEAINDIAKRHQIFVIEDAAQAMGTEYIFSDGSRKKAGTMSHIGCTSFYPSKNLACYGDGGAIFTDDEKLASRIRSMVNHGQSKKYFYDHIGVNSRLDTVQAAILRVKLKYLDEFLESRIKAAAFYDRAFEPVPQILTPQRVDYSTHTFHQYTITLFGPCRNNLQNYLNDKGIPSMLYYPLPFHLQKAYQDLNYKKGDFPVSEEMADSVLSLPMHTELDEIQLEYITGHVIQFIAECNPK